MKKILTIIAIACIAFATPSQAQVKFGLKGGLNLTSLSADNIAGGVSNKSGFFVGPTVKFQSVQIPINVRYGFGLSSVVNVFAFAGPQFGFNIGDKSKLLDQMGSWSLKSSNISGNVGIGATVFSKLQITANYNFQLSKSGEVEYKDANGATQTGKMKFNSWQLGLGYYF